MYTAEDIRNVMFTKSMGGYKTGEVDLFIDQCADTVEALTRKNAEQAKKLEVLAERLMEYRKDEDNIHTALLSAQRAGDALLREAQHKADLILQDASIKAENIKESAERDIQREQDTLKRVKEEVAAFKNRLLDMYRQHLTAIDALPEEEQEQSEEPLSAAEQPAAEPLATEGGSEPAAKAVPEQAEDNVQDIFSSSELSEKQSVAEPMEEQADMTYPLEEVQTETPTQTALFRESPEDEQEKRGSRFEDLQFGPEYEIDHESRHRLFGKRK